MHFSKQLLLTAVACLAPVVSHAASVTSNPSLSVGGLNFGGFTCSLSKGGVSATPNSCGEINVNTITQPGMGIAFSTLFSAGAGSFDDAVLGYNVSSGAGISSVGLDFNGTWENLGISSVTESIYSDGVLVGFAKVSTDASHTNYTDQISLNGVYHNLFIKKDIGVVGYNGNAQSSFVDQTFTTAAPEPGSTALLGSGLLAIAGLLRRRSNKSKQQA